MVFSLESYTHPDCAMHCKNEYEAYAFLEFLDKHGRKWNGGNRYTKLTNYEQYGEDTCYFFNTGEYADLNYCLEKGYEVLNCSDFDGFTDDCDEETPEEDTENFNNFIHDFIIYQG